MKQLFSEDDIPEYDPELHGARRHRGRLPPAPLKSALKKPPAAYTNAAFEGDTEAGGARTSFLPEEPAPAAPASSALPAAEASSELTEQLRLLNELNKTLKEEQRQAPDIELPRVEGLVQPAAAAAEPKLFSMNDDG